jgi:hypothetical protein
MREAAKILRPRPLREQKFIEAYFTTRSIEKASILCGMKLNAAEAMYAKPDVKAEIDRKIGLVDTEIVKQAAAKAIIHMELLDEELKKTVILDPKKYGATKLKAMEMGYGRLGMFREGNFSVPNAGADPNKPSIFRASERTVRRTTEEITERKVEGIGLTKVSEF